MSSKHTKQEVWYDIKFPDGETVSGPIEATVMNLEDVIKKKLAQFNLTKGAVITLRVSECVDEFANEEH